MPVKSVAKEDVARRKKNKSLALTPQQRRITALIASGVRGSDKATIKKWLSINEELFREDPDYFTNRNRVEIKPIQTGNGISVKRLVLNKYLTGAYQFFSFVGAVKQLIILHDCIGEDTDLKQELLTQDECSAFRSAAKDGRLDVMKTLWSFTGGNKKLQQQLLNAKDCYAFRKAAELQVFLADYDGFRKTTENHYLDVVNTLWGFANEAGDDELKEEWLEIYTIYAFCEAAANGHLDVVKIRWALTSEDKVLQRKLLMADECRALSGAASNNHLDVVKTLWDFAGEDNELKQEWLRVYTDCVFWGAAVLDHFDIVKTFCTFAGDDNKLKQRWLEKCSKKHIRTDKVKTKSIIIASIATTDLFELVSRYRWFWSTRLEKLIKQGADINACNNEGKSILELAIRASNDSLATALLEQGAEITEENVDSVFKAFLEVLQEKREFHPVLAKKIFTEIHVKSIEFDSEKAFRDAPPRLKRRYQEVVEGKSSIELEIRAGEYSIAKDLLDQGEKITEENVASILEALKDSFQTLAPETEESMKHFHLAEKIFKEISTKSIKFNYEEAFSDAPQLGEYYQSIRSGVVIRRARSPFFLSASTTHHAVNLGTDKGEQSAYSVRS